MSRSRSPLPKKNTLITGPPGVGKTTSVKDIAGMLREDVDGFYTDEIREGGERKGFRIVSLAGETGVLAHVDIKGVSKTGRYTVNIADLDEIGVVAIRRAMKTGKAIIVDEIGKMELLSAAFRSTVIEAIDSPCPVIATIMDKEETFCDAIKARSDIQTVHVTKENRDAVPGEVVGLLRKYLYSDTQ